MKKTLHLGTLFLMLGCVAAYGQDFVSVSQSDARHEVKLSQNQALEVRLPSTPSSGYGWYVSNGSGQLKQIGNWEFVSDNPSNPIGSAGVQINHFVSTAPGTTNLELLYKRPWENANQATSTYKIQVVSSGVYTGVEVKPYIPVDNSSVMSGDDGSALGLPASFDWMAQNLCTPVKNQQQCGSCWAFASCGIFESEVKIWDNVTRDVSEQWLVNCTQGSTCAGGWFPGSMYTSTGCVYEPDEPYTGQDGTCGTYSYHEKPVGYKAISGNSSVASTPKIKQAIYDYGPVWVAVDAGNNFQNYSGGVMNASDGTACNHAVVLTGWDDNTQSWVLRNSWGTGWGINQGYMKIGWGVSAVGTAASYFDYKGPINHNPTGINTLNNGSSVRVFPNPSNGEFTFSGLEKANNIQVYDYVGNEVYHTAASGSTVTVDMKNMSQGIYVYKITNASTHSVQTGKLVVY